MNQLTIIGNLTRDPETRTTQAGINVCTFSVAVNGSKKDDVTYIRVSAWRQLGDNCQKYLTKGKKVCVVGPVSINQYTKSNGENGATLDINAEHVEFLSPAGEKKQEEPAKGTYTEVTEDELPF